MCQVISFPTDKDRLVMERALRCLLKDRQGVARKLMIGVLRCVLDKYGASKICLQQSVVVRGRQGEVRIFPRKTKKEKVPVIIEAEIGWWKV